MDKSTITKFYPYQKKSSGNIDQVKRRLNKDVSLKKAEIVSNSSEKNVQSISPIARNTRSSSRAKSKPILTRQSSKIDDFFNKSQTTITEEDQEVLLKVTLKTPLNINNDNKEDNCVLSSLKTLEKSSDESSTNKISSPPGFVTPTKSNSKLSSPHKRRYVATVVPSSLSDDYSSTIRLVDDGTPESSTRKEKESATIDRGEKINSKNRSVRKKLSLGEDDEDVLKDEIESVNVIKKPKSVVGNADAPKVSTSEFWDLGFSPLNNILKPVSPLPQTPQKLRDMRQATAVNPGTSSNACVLNLTKILENPSSPGKPQIDLKVTKASLSKCGKLEELKKHLLKMKELKEQHNQITKAAKSPVKSPAKSPAKATQNEACNKTIPSPNKAPAYERFKHLVLPSVPTLTLPNCYTTLEDFFKSTDTVVSMLFNRSEVCTFTKVKAAVQEMAKRNFEAKNLGQIKTVYPGAYEFKQEKGLPKSGYKYQGYQLTLTPLFDAINSKDASEEKVKFTSSDILRRQKIFHNSLVNLVKKKHKVFLQNININIPEEKLTRWHPRFRLDEIPEIEPTALPEPPYMKVYQTAKDVLDDTKRRLHPKVKSALENVAAASAQQTPVIPTSPASNSKKDDLKGIPQGLLERIRAKEAQRLEESITRSPGQDYKNKMLDRLPEISRILRTYFVTEKKPAMLFDHLLDKIIESYKSPLSKADVENHVKLLLEVAPNWITVANTMKGKYLKLDKTVKLQNVHEKINQYRKSL